MLYLDVDTMAATSAALHYTRSIDDHIALVLATATAAIIDCCPEKSRLRLRSFLERLVFALRGVRFVAVLVDLLALDLLDVRQGSEV